MLKFLITKSDDDLLIECDSLKNDIEGLHEESRKLHERKK